MRGGTELALRPACADGTRWDGHACTPIGDAARHIAAGKQDLADFKVDDANAELAAAEHAGPLDHDANVTLWEQRGIAAAYVDKNAEAAAAFDMLLALDPSHFLSYTLSPKATFVFEKARAAAQTRGAPALDVEWPHGLTVGSTVPLDVEVVADPKHFLKSATIYVRARGETAWQAADLTLPAIGNYQRVRLPAVHATKPVSLELYVRAFDDRHDEVLAWADPARPREIPLRYDPPPPWYRTWWVIAIAGSVVAIGTGITVYELTLAPPNTIGGTVH
jgi:hypothetical protein